MPFGVIDFNRADLLGKYISSRIPSIVWLDEIPGWRGETDAYLALFSKRETLLRQDYPTNGWCM